MQRRRRASLLGAMRQTAGDVKGGRPPQPFVDRRDERAVHGTLRDRRNRRARRRAQHVKETVPELGGLAHQAAGQLDRILAHCVAR